MRDDLHLDDDDEPELDLHEGEFLKGEWGDGGTVVIWKEAPDVYRCCFAHQGPDCPLCQPYDAAMAGCLENVARGTMKVVNLDATGAPLFCITEGGVRRIQEMLAGEAE